MLFYQSRRLTEHPPASPILSGPQPGPAITAQQSSLHLPPQLTRAGSSTCPRHRTCSHSCWAWLDLTSMQLPACPPPLTCLGQEPFPAFSVLWLTLTRHRVKERSLSPGAQKLSYPNHVTPTTEAGWTEPVLVPLRRAPCLPTLGPKPLGATASYRKKPTQELAEMGYAVTFFGTSHRYKSISTQEGLAQGHIDVAAEISIQV